MEEIDEGSSQTVEVRFFSDVAMLVPATPTSITYSVRCKTSGASIKTNVVIAPASVITIPLDSLDSAIQNTANAFEEKILTVKAVYTVTDKCNSEYVWRVKNLSGV